MTRLSVVIVAKDEERIIGRTIEAVRSVADEIIVVDSGSTDRTKEIASESGARVVHQDWLGYACQKNVAIDMAAGDWILSLDADEVLTPEVVAEIKQVVEAPVESKADGYKVPRILFIGDVPVKHGGFFPDAQLRLFKRGTGRFKERRVHERIFVDGAVEEFKHPMHHYAYRDVDEFARAMDKYAQLSAREYHQDGSYVWRANVVNEYLHPVWTFVLRYMLRMGFLDGPLGLKLNLIYSSYVRNKIKYLRQQVREGKSS